MGKSYYVFSSGRVGRKENTIFISNEDRKKYIPVEDVEEIYFFGEVELNSRFLSFASSNFITLHFFNYYGMYTGSFYPRERHETGLMIVKQVEHYLDSEKRTTLARKFVDAALHNIRRILSKRGYVDVEAKIKEYQEMVKSSESPADIMVHEAHARRAYYSVWEDITGWPFEAREFHPPSNELNALISFGNALLYAKMLSELYKTPLNPTISYLHEPGERKRFSLVLDLSEIFKPVFVDRLIFRLINQKKLSREAHFLPGTEGTFLNEEGRKIFVQEFDNLMESTLLHRALKRKVKYKSLIRLEAYKLVKHLIGEKEYKPLKVWW